MAIGAPLYSCSCQVDEEETVVSPSFKASQKSQWPELNHLDEKGRKNSSKKLSLCGVAWVPTGVCSKSICVTQAPTNWNRNQGQIKTTMGTPDMKRASLNGELA